MCQVSNKRCVLSITDWNAESNSPIIYLKNNFKCVYILDPILWFLGTFLLMLLLLSVSVLSDSLWPHGRQHTWLPSGSQSPEVCSSLCPSNWWYHPTISSSVIPFSCLQSFPGSGSFWESQFFASGGQSIGASASALALLMNIQGWFPLGWTGLISLQSKGFSRVFSSTTVQNHQFFSVKPSL